MSKLIEMLDEIMQDGHQRDLIRQFTENEIMQGKTIRIDTKDLINFGSCSYMGLELNQVLIDAGKEAIQKYGTQFSSSRAYLSIGLYKELEDLLSKAFGKPVIATASTTLGHLSALPVLIEEGDAIIMDLQVHSSVQMTAKLLKNSKIPIYVIRHNDMESLEMKIKELKGNYNKVWYLADGVYSMYGDFAPLNKIVELLDCHEQFHLYIDDAHGMGWTGENGIGYVRSTIEHHDKMVIATSMNKSFAASGGILVLPNQKWEDKIRNCGSTLIFSGPIQPPMLGVAIASAKLHQSRELKDRQLDLAHKVKFANDRLKELNLPQFKENKSPIFFIPVGMPQVTYDIVGEMKRLGFYLNVAGFPAVAMKKSGIRFMINAHLGLAEINSMLSTLKKVYLLMLEKHSSNENRVAETFNIPKFSRSKQNDFSLKEETNLSIQVVHSISEIDPQLWNKFYSNEGTLAYKNLLAIERLFSNNDEKENNWKFYYCVIRNENNEIVLMCSYTSVLVKEDMFSPGKTSKLIENKRKKNPYYLTKNHVMTGSMITKGNHLYLNQEIDNWRDAVKLFVNQLQSTVETENAGVLMIREFEKGENPALKKCLFDLGLMEFSLPNNCLIDNLSWSSTQEYLSSLGQKYRYNVRKEILQFEDQFVLEFNKSIDEKIKIKCYELYLKVHEKAYDLNVFKLPYSFFEYMFESTHYDVMRMYHKSENGDIELVAVMFSYVNGNSYNAMIVGLDYDYVYTNNTYKQILYQTVRRAQKIGCKKIDLAYTAELEKKKVGARPIEMVAYIQMMDHFNAILIDSMGD